MGSRVVAALRGMLEHDRRQAGWSFGQAAWRLGVSLREYREIEARRALAELGDLRPDLQALRLATDVRRRSTAVGSAVVEASRLPDRLRNDLLRYPSATFGERARLIGELSERNPGMADLLIDLESDDDLRARFEVELLRGSQIRS